MGKEKWKTLSALNQTVIDCQLCQRLVEFRESIPKRKAFQDDSYWRRPTPGFGDPKAKLLILGLAPSAHGGNRTGRIFTGDESAKFLMKNLHHVNMANIPTSQSRDDNLKLKNCYITAVVKCVPPQNRPTKTECENCQRYWVEELRLLPQVNSILTLGRTAFERFVKYAKSLGHDMTGIIFSHGMQYQIKNFYTLYASYHPSPQNTYTGKLTNEMFINLLNKISKNQFN